MPPADMNMQHNEVIQHRMKLLYINVAHIEREGYSALRKYSYPLICSRFMLLSYVKML